MCRARKSESVTWRDRHSSSENARRHGPGSLELDGEDCVSVQHLRQTRSVVEMLGPWMGLSLFSCQRSVTAVLTVGVLGCPAQAQGR